MKQQEMSQQMTALYHQLKRSIGRRGSHHPKTKAIQRQYRAAIVAHIRRHNERRTYAERTI